jgi:RNA polymerase sigma-70 factor (ECF subfamily)
MNGSWDQARDPLAALRDGDSGPFEELVRRRSRHLLGFFMRQGAGMHEAEDLTQEVFLKLYRAAPRYRPEERFAAFCFRVARNVWIDGRRRAGARLETALSASRDAEEGAAPRGPLCADVPADGRGPAEAASLSEEDRRVRAALADLDEPHRMVFELGVIEELSYAEIGSILAIPVGTVKSRMFHAVRKLRALLEGEEAAR